MTRSVQYHSLMWLYPGSKGRSTIAGLTLDQRHDEYSWSIMKHMIHFFPDIDGHYLVASELKDPIWHSLEWQIGSFSSEATIFSLTNITLRRIILCYRILGDQSHFVNGEPVKTVVFFTKHTYRDIQWPWNYGYQHLIPHVTSNGCIVIINETFSANVAGNDGLTTPNASPIETHVNCPNSAGRIHHFSIY